MKKIIAILVMTVSLVGCNRASSDEPAETKADIVGKAVLNTALQVSDLDASVLSGIADKLEGSCSRNKFGLTEEACIQKIRDQKNTCTQQTAEKYPGQLSNVDRMQEVMSSFVNCIFKE